MIAVRVFDPPMCCSTGICGPAVDPVLVRFAADLDWLNGRGVSVERFNLSQQPAAFVEDAAVKSALEAMGEASLPLIEINGVVKSTGAYPSREQLASWAGVDSGENAAPKKNAGGCCGGAEKAEAPAGAKSGGCCGGSEKAEAPAGAKSGGCCGGAEKAEAPSGPKSGRCC